MAKADFFSILQDFFKETNFTWNHDDWVSLLDNMQTAGYKVNEVELGAILEREREAYYKKIEDKAEKSEDNNTSTLAKLLEEREKQLDLKEVEYHEREKELTKKGHELSEKEEMLHQVDEILAQKVRDFEFLNRGIMEQTLTLDKKELDLQGYERSIGIKYEEILAREADIIKEESELERFKSDILKREKAYEKLVVNLRERLDDLKEHSDRLHEMEQNTIARIEGFEEKILKARGPRTEIINENSIEKKLLAIEKIKEKTQAKTVPNKKVPNKKTLTKKNIIKKSVDKKKSREVKKEKNQESSKLEKLITSSEKTISKKTPPKKAAAKIATKKTSPKKTIGKEKEIAKKEKSTSKE